MRVKGRVWKFGDDINTDLMQPMEALQKPREERVQHIFQANRPGWVEKVQEGDVIVAGENFGVGSGRPAPEALRDAGIAAVVAESINGLFFRNCINSGLPAVECAGCTEAIDEGDVITVDTEQGVVRVQGEEGVERSLECQSLPPVLEELLRQGGVFPWLKDRGLIASTEEMKL